VVQVVRGAVWKAYLTNRFIEMEQAMIRKNSLFFLLTKIYNWYTLSYRQTGGHMNQVITFEEFMNKPVELKLEIEQATLKFLEQRKLELQEELAKIDNQIYYVGNRAWNLEIAAR
jgi:hypothetical protein